MCCKNNETTRMASRTSVAISLRTQIRHLYHYSRTNVRLHTLTFALGVRPGPSPMRTSLYGLPAMAIIMRGASMSPRPFQYFNAVTDGLDINAVTYAWQYDRRKKKGGGQSARWGVICRGLGLACS